MGIARDCGVFWGGRGCFSFGRGNEFIRRGIDFFWGLKDSEAGEGRGCVSTEEILRTDERQASHAESTRYDFSYLEVASCVGIKGFQCSRLVFFSVNCSGCMVKLDNMYGENW